MTRPTIDDDLARRLVDTQFPQWSARPLRRVAPAGSDHVIYRPGEELSVRLPRHDGAIGQAAKDLCWLPRLAPHLPLTVPEPVAVGRPDFALGMDDARWARGRGWALAGGLTPPCPTRPRTPGSPPTPPARSPPPTSADPARTARPTPAHTPGRSLDHRPRNGPVAPGNPSLRGGRAVRIGR